MNEIMLKSKIHTIRGKQVLLDRDLAQLYEIETRVLKQAVNRNKSRFPSDFMFELNDFEINLMVSQTVIPSKQHLGGSKPYVFTEQGVAMLSSILKSELAIQINISVMRAFVQMRHFLQSNAEIFQRLDKTEQKLLIHDNKIEEVFNLIQEKDIKPQKGIFFDGQIFDAYKFIIDLIKSAKQEIILIDNFIDEDVLILFSQTKLPVLIYTKNINEKLLLSLKKYNQQYRNIQIKEFNKSHDRFLIIDKKIYHIGASLKDLGKKWFAFSKFEHLELLTKLP
ncbi:MAG: ORF6N domain-containing protein [Candidatus Nanoarchaeia archaeon]|nr:ORF6N domain-containing protein [Candidatus Nanoarchaeia archaeon]